MKPGERALRQAKEGAHEGLQDFAKSLQELSAREIPVGDPAEDPNLAVSIEGSWREDWHGPDRVRVGYHTAYAAYQHERRQNEHPRGGKPQYLTDPLKALIPYFDNVVAGKVRARIKAR